MSETQDLVRQVLKQEGLPQSVFVADLASLGTDPPLVLKTFGWATNDVHGTVTIWCDPGSIIGPQHYKYARDLALKVDEVMVDYGFQTYHDPERNPLQVLVTLPPRGARSEKLARVSKVLAGLAILVAIWGTVIDRQGPWLLAAVLGFLALGFGLESDFDKRHEINERLQKGGRT